MANDFDANVEQAKAAYRYYIQGDRTIAWDPASRRWVPTRTSTGDDAGPRLSGRAAQRIEEVRGLEAAGAISPTQAASRVNEILREET
jgi:hypothetical protein